MYQYGCPTSGGFHLQGCRYPRNWAFLFPTLGVNRVVCDNGIRLAGTGWVLLHWVGEKDTLIHGVLHDPFFPLVRPCTQPWSSTPGPAQKRTA